MTKRWLMAVLIAVVVLTACTADIPTEDSPTVTTAPTVPVQTDVAVTDAYTGELETDGERYTYHVPQISVAGEMLTQANAEIYAMLYDGILVNQVFAEEGNPRWADMQYTWGENGEIVSVVVSLRDRLTDSVTYLAVNVDKAVGTVVTDREKVIACYGLTEEAFDEKVSRLLEEEYARLYQSMIAQVGKAAYDEKLSLMLSGEMVGRAAPFVGEAGKLCVVADMASFDGADYYKLLLNVT